MWPTSRSAVEIGLRLDDLLIFTVGIDVLFRLGFKSQVSMKDLDLDLDL